MNALEDEWTDRKALETTFCSGFKRIPEEEIGSRGLLCNISEFETCREIALAEKVRAGGPRG
jgi:hypothetical protein